MNSCAKSRKAVIYEQVLDSDDYIADEVPEA